MYNEKFATTENNISTKDKSKPLHIPKNSDCILQRIPSIWIRQHHHSHYTCVDTTEVLSSPHLLAGLKLRQRHQQMHHRQMFQMISTQEFQVLLAGVNENINYQSIKQLHYRVIILVNKCSMFLIFERRESNLKQDDSNQSQRAVQ